MTRRTASLLRACAAGAVFGCGIGLGAHNGWLMALLIGVPLIVTGVVLAPRPTRISELPVWADVRPGVDARVDAVTRSTLGALERQPTLITATVSPSDDTPYEARWLASTTGADVKALLDDPHVQLSDALVPSRTASTPEFDDVPGRAVLAYPVITLVVMAVVLAAIPASVWRVDLDLSSTSSSGRPGQSAADFAERLDAVREHASAMSPTAADNILRIQLTDSSDTVVVFVPETGEELSAFHSSRQWYESSRLSQSRRADTFTLRDLASFDVETAAAAMARGLPQGQRGLRGLTVARPGAGRPPLVTGVLGPSAFDEHKVQARLSGEVAEVFDPGDLAASMRAAATAIRDASLSTSDPVLTRFEIRGSRVGTPIMRAGAIQIGGGVLVEYTTAALTGQIVIVPGFFPTSGSPPYANTAGRLPRGGVAFDQLSEAVFTRIRDDAMRRGDVDAFDRSSIDLQVTQGGPKDDYGPIIFAAVGPSAQSVGTYGLAGDFIRPGTF